eukprot:gb/GECG01010815.1/.p1 GENE.gb/GECG01010815.1/~~gb/GECG01010815.1/.p1  ORF type:complete len:428 (+),score=41.58 gb/GECG01010815.1/:1-1284(+)
MSTIEYSTSSVASEAGLTEAEAATAARINPKGTLYQETAVDSVRVRIPLELYQLRCQETLEKIRNCLSRLKGSIQEYDSLYQSGKIDVPIVHLNDREVTQAKYPLLANAREQNWEAVVDDLCSTSLPELMSKYQRVYWRIAMSEIGCGVYELPTQEVMQVLCRVLLSLGATDVEEMGAGQGLFTLALRRYSARYGSEKYKKLRFTASNPPYSASQHSQDGRGVDDTRVNWNMGADVPYSIDDMKNRLFEDYDGTPDTIFISWVPPRSSDQFESLFRKKLPRHVIFIGDAPSSSSSVTYEFILPAIREGYHVSFIPIRGCNVFTDWQTRVQLNPSMKKATTVLTVISKDKSFTKEEVRKIVPSCAQGDSPFYGSWNPEAYSSHDRLTFQMMTMLDSVAYTMWIEKYKQVPNCYTWCPGHGGFLSLGSF